MAYGGRVFWWRQESAGTTLAFTGRDSGVSTGRYAGLNLGGHVGDASTAVEANRRSLAAAVGVDREHLLFMEQCHGAEVAVVEGPHAEGMAPAVDAMVTVRPGLALAVLVADCTPILLWDNRTDVIGVAHAGRPGLVGGIVRQVVAAMRDLGATQLAAAVGPSVCGRCYEVPAELRERAADIAPSSRAVSWQGTPAIDIATGVVEQLTALDVRVRWVAGCTREQPDLYSYRRDGRTGRFAGVVVRRR